MTISGILQKVLTTASVAVSITLLWLALSAVILLATDEAEAVMVLLPSPALIRHLPEDALLLEANSFSATVAGIRPAFVADLYSRGALLVLPTRRRSCLAASTG